MDLINHCILSCEWKIEKFGDFCMQDDRTVKYHELPFNPSINSVAKFALFCGCELNDEHFGVLLKEMKTDKGLETQIKVWILDDDGGRFEIWPVANHKFQKVDEKCSFDGHLTGGGGRCVFAYARDSNSSLTIGCELKLLNPSDVVPVLYTENIVQKLWSRYKKGIQSGVVIQVDDKVFTVDQNVLECQSEVFGQALSSNFKETQTGKIEINDFDVSTVEGFIHWLYSGNIDSEQLTDKLLVFGETYQIKDLKEQCAALMASNLTDSNVIQRLILSLKFNSDTLKQSVLDYLLKKKESEKFELFMSDDSWYQFSLSHEDTAKAFMKDFYSKIQ